MQATPMIRYQVARAVITEALDDHDLHKIVWEELRRANANRYADDHHRVANTVAQHIIRHLTKQSRRTVALSELELRRESHRRAQRVYTGELNV